MFARSHYEPRISETDEDKLARFYADLRKESLASGAIPITVRYLESMIRMAESFAKMQLHDSVSQADIDRAISVMVKSFVSTQKIGAQRALEKYLKKYMSFAEDSEELLSYILSDMMNDEWKFYYFNKQKGPDTLEIDVKLFSLRASDYGIDDLTMFLKSALFKSTFRLDANRGVIIKDMRASGEGRADGGVSSSQIYEDEEMDFVGSQV